MDFHTMTGDRVTVSLDDDTSTALETLTERTGDGQSELVRQALTSNMATLWDALGTLNVNATGMPGRLATRENRTTGT